MFNISDILGQRFFREFSEDYGQVGQSGKGINGT